MLKTNRERYKHQWYQKIILNNNNTNNNNQKIQNKLKILIIMIVMIITVRVYRNKTLKILNLRRIKDNKED